MFEVLNARALPVEKLLRFDTGRTRQREIVRQAILDSSHNVYLHGTRGSGKTFFQKTQAYYFQREDKEILPLYIPWHMKWGIDDDSSDAFALHVLSTLLLEWWQRAYERPKSDLFRFGTTGEDLIPDSLRPDQQRFLQLYNIIHASQLTAQRHQASLLGAAAIAKAEKKWNEGQTVLRGALLPSELSAVLSELADVMSQAKTRRIVVHLDEVELMVANRGEDFYSICLEVFNPVGVQFIVTGTPSLKSDHESLLSSFETSFELEGLDTVADLGSMISKYSEGESFRFSEDALDILFEFFGGHPRNSLASCAQAIEREAHDNEIITPLLMTKACLLVERRLQEAEYLQRTRG